MQVLNFLAKTWKKIRPRSWKRFFFYLFVLGVALVVYLVLLVFYYSLQVPDPSIISARRVSESTKIYDRTGETILYDVHGEEKRTIIPWQDIPQNIKNATLALEDTNFYTHSGVDTRGIIRALYQDLRNLETSQGGSTITQQLVKLAIVGEEKKISRKIKEAILAIRLERTYSKDQIFWMYLNQIPYGSNAYGIEAASQTFFGKSAKDVTIAEASILASLPQAPSYYSPYGTHVDALLGRSAHALQRMRELDMITESEYQQALLETPKFVERVDRFPAPHFITTLVKPYLLEKYGEDLVENGGLKVVTTLDIKHQTIAEDVVTKYGTTNVKKYRANNAAFTSLDPKTGQILSMVGSRDYFGKSEPEGCSPGLNCKFDPHVNVALRKRQPGSSFKPFAYATAFMKGFPDTTVLFDVFTEFNPSCRPSGDQTTGTGACYHPHNYNGGFSGPVTLRQALARSLNIPSVKTLYLAGVEDTVETASKMGISSLNPNSYYGLSLVLGGVEVSLMDMVSAYGVFANDGVRTPPVFILKVTTADGSILEEYKLQEERILPPNIARTVSDILSDNNARSATFGFSNNLVVSGRQVAAKTGTTQNNRDGWLIGYTPSLVAGVWTGNNDDTPMTAAGAGVSAAGPMWNEYMTRALKSSTVESFPTPDPIVSDQPMRNGSFIGPNGEIHSILYYINQNDPQFFNWDYAVQLWRSATFPPTPTTEPQPTP